MSPGDHRRGGADRPDDFEGDDSETLVAEEGVKVEPEAQHTIYRSELNAPLRVKLSLPVVLAVAVHVAVFSAAILLPKLFGGPPPLRKPIIARLVAQGKPLDQHLLPRKDQPPPPAASAPKTAPVLTPDPKAPPSHPTPSKLAAAPAPKKAAPRQPTREELMQRALAGVSGDRDRSELKKDEERVGQENGSPEGTASSAEEGDTYFGAVQAEILAHYTLPSIISERERMSLKATIIAWIGPDGTILKYTFDHRSGNAQFDSALERAIKSSKVPPPPADRARAIREDGVALVFTP
jgi:colicin import membrane protein